MTDSFTLLEAPSIFGAIITICQNMPNNYEEEAIKTIRRKYGNDNCSFAQNWDDEKALAHGILAPTTIGHDFVRFWINGNYELLDSFVKFLCKIVARISSEIVSVE